MFIFMYAVSIVAYTRISGQQFFGSGFPLQRCEIALILPGKTPVADRRSVCHLLRREIPV